MLGIILLDVLQAAPSYWSEALPVVEFVIYNTPGPHKFTPRDIDRRLSVASPLEQELIPFEVLDHEPMTDYVQRIFAEYRLIRETILEYYGQTSEKRAKHANRFRKHRAVEVGMKVVYRDPRARAAGGRTPWKQPLTEPLTVVAIDGNKLKLRQQDGSVIEGAHMENCVVVPNDVVDYERDLEFMPDDDDSGARASIGMQLEEAAVAKDKPVRDLRAKNPTTGKFDKISLGTYVVYSSNHKKKECRIGHVTSLARTEQLVVVHRHFPIQDSRIRVRWMPAYLTSEGIETLEPGDRPSKERLDISRVLSVVTLDRQGVMGHAAGRRLDNQGWRLDESQLPSPAEVMLLEPVLPMAERLERVLFNTRTPADKAVRWQEDDTFKKWMVEGFVDYLEL